MKKYDFEVTLKIAINEEAIGDIVCTALEGGVGYWACLDNTGERWHREGDEDKPLSEIATEILLEGGAITLVDEDDGNKRHDLTLDALLRGIKEYVDSYCNPREYIDDGEFFADNIDAGMPTISFSLRCSGSSSMAKIKTVPNMTLWEALIKFGAVDTDIEEEIGFCPDYKVCGLRRKAR